MVVASCGGEGGVASPAASFSPGPLGAAEVAQALETLAGEASFATQTLSADAAGAPSDAPYTEWVKRPAMLSGGPGFAAGGADACAGMPCAPRYPDSPLPPPHDLTLAKGRLRLETDDAAGTATMAEGAAAPAPIGIMVKGPDEEWTATTDVSWLRLASTQGRGWGSLIVVFDPAGLPPGRHVGQVMARNGAGETTALPLRLDVWPSPQRRLLPSEWGVGLASTPGGDVLSRTLTVRDSMGGAIAWKARADVPWLAVTSSGMTKGGAGLKLSADPAALETDTLAVATVTVTAQSGDVAPATIRVALWKGSTGPSAMRKLALHYATVVADRIRPYVYAHAGGSSVDIFHAYTAQKIGTIDAAAVEAGSMAVSPDGERLYVLDPRAGALAVIDLATGRKIGTWPLTGTLSARTPVLAVRPDGVDVVLLGNGTAYTGGLPLGTTPIAGYLAASADGTRIYAQRAIPTTMAAFEIGYQAGGAGGTLKATTVAERSAGPDTPFGADIAIDGASAVYAAFDSPNQCVAMNPSNLSTVDSLSAGDAFPNNVEVTGDGRIICGFPTWSRLQPDFRVYSSAGAALTSHKITGPYHKLRTGELVVTPDGLAVVALTDDPAMAFVAIGASAATPEPPTPLEATAQLGGQRCGDGSTAGRRKRHRMHCPQGAARHAPGRGA